MTREEEVQDYFVQEDHQAAYVFQPVAAQSAGHGDERPKKRRRVPRKRAVAPPVPDPVTDPAGHRRPDAFLPLLNGAESEACVRRREALFRRTWDGIEARVLRVLRDANTRTLEQVGGFVESVTGNGEEVDSGRLPAAFIITGPNVTAQELLFAQLADSLRGGAGSRSRFVRLRAADASNLKGVLKRIIKEGMARVAGGGGGDDGAEDDDEELEIRDIGGKKYLDYDLEALHALVKTQGLVHFFVAFQDSEAFDGGLLSDLIHLFGSWRLRIPFTLLFGIATSVEFLQDRLLRSTARCIHGAQFDVVQAATVVERVLRCAVAGDDVSLRLGPSLLRNMLDRQREQMAGVRAFVSSLKYSHMCHFYANPLSIFSAHLEDEWDGSLVQREHLQAVRTLPSFRDRVERAVEEKRPDEARALLLNDAFLTEEIAKVPYRRKEWATRLLRSLQLLREVGDYGDEDYSTAYLRTLDEGIDPSAEEALLRDPVQRMRADEFIALLGRLAACVESGDGSVGPAAWSADASEFLASLAGIAERAESLLSRATRSGTPLRSKYNSQSRIMRTTVVAQRVQLTRDSAALTDHDRAFTALVDRLVDVLAENIRCEPAAACFLHETWFYDSQAPLRNVLVPRPRLAIERSLRRPHDYLNCKCCGGGGGGGDGDKEGGDGAVLPTLPPTAVLYRLYLESGNLINVADLWAAFLGIVGRNENGDDAADGQDERAALVMFYQGLSELKTLGFVKGSKRKVDHIAKLKWL